MFKDMTVDQLKAKAKDMKIPGYGNMNKAALLEAVEKAYSFVSGDPESAKCPVSGEPCDCENKNCSEPKESSSESSDLNSHPKFAKFKTSEEQQ